MNATCCAASRSALRTFALFAGSDYYPDGGWKDYRGAFDTERDALIAAAALGADWFHVVNLPTGEIVAQNPAP